MHLREIITTLCEADHHTGDKVRLRKVVAHYRDILQRIHDLRDIGKHSAIKPEQYTRWMGMLRTELDAIKPYFQTYHQFRNATEDAETEWLFKKGVYLIKAWFEGWHMNTATTPALRAFLCLQRMFPNPAMTLFRVITVKDANQARNLTQIQAGPRSMQSWTTDFKSAMRFFKKQYADHRETMTVDSKGVIGYEDKMLNNDFIIIKARLPGSAILWTPATMPRLERYDMHAIDSKLYDDYSRIPDEVTRVLFDYSGENEVIVYIPNNDPVPLLSVTPLFHREQVSDQAA